jgi:hypothetical protein
MSDKTIFNQDLVLNQLVISNSTDSAASGYVPQSTVITSGSITTTNLSGNALFLNATGFPSTVMTNVNGVMSSNDAIASNDYLYAPVVNVGTTLNIKQSPISVNDVALSCGGNDILSVGGTVNATSVGIISPSGSVGLTAAANNTLEVGGNVQCSALGAQSVSLQSGASSVALINSNSVITTGSPIDSAAYISALTFIGGMVCANWVPATPITCAPGLYTGTTCVIQNVPTNINYDNCVYSFQAQALNAQTGCVPVVFPSYTATLNGNDLTLTIYISVAAGSAGATINYIGIMIINPGYSAVAP